MSFKVEGFAELRRKLMAMEKGAAAEQLGPLVTTGGAILHDAAIQLAPKRTGKGAGSITVQLIKAGSGYAYVLIGPQADYYYMMFQEYGLGSGRSTPVSERVKRRKGNYEHSMNVRRGLLDQGIAPQDFMRAYWDWRNTRGGGKAHRRITNAPFGLSVGELRRQKILAQSAIEGRRWDLQGGHRPNMAAHPFMRPAIDAAWPEISAYITSRLVMLIEGLARAA